MALIKCSYLKLNMSFNGSWANFYVVRTIQSNKLTLKRDFVFILLILKYVLEYFITKIK